jgi:hypothetical protein
MSFVDVLLLMFSAVLIENFIFSRLLDITADNYI